MKIWMLITIMFSLAVFSFLTPIQSSQTSATPIIPADLDPFIDGLPLKAKQVI